jgi:hypothetical protein
METYNASEGFFGIQDDPSDPACSLWQIMAFFNEFVPAEKATADSPPVLTIGEIETGRNYALVITTNGGLWRYMLGDTVTFSSLYLISSDHRPDEAFYKCIRGRADIDNAEKAWNRPARLQVQL